MSGGGVFKLAFTWTKLPVNNNSKIEIEQLNEIYTNINIARSNLGLIGNVSSGKTGIDDIITAEDINKVRAEVDIISNNYTTGCVSHYTIYQYTGKSSINSAVYSAVNNQDCNTIFISTYSNNRSSYNLSV